MFEQIKWIDPSVYRMFCRLKYRGMTESQLRREGETFSNLMYTLSSARRLDEQESCGEIEIYKIRGDRSEERVVIRPAGEHFGELGPLLGLPRSASARAVGHAVVTGYSVGDFRDRFGGDIEVGAALQSDPV